MRSELRFSDGLHEYVLTRSTELFFAPNRYAGCTPLSPSAAKPILERYLESSAGGDQDLGDLFTSQSGPLSPSGASAARMLQALQQGLGGPGRLVLLRAPARLAAIVTWPRLRVAPLEPAPSKAAPAPKKEPQRFKLVELIEVVQRGGEVVVEGAAPASKAPGRKTGETRKDKAGAAFKQLINLGKDLEGAAARSPAHDRTITLRARIDWTSGDKSQALSGKRVHWTFTCSKGAGRPDNLTGDERAGFVGTTKEELVTQTDAQGWTDPVTFRLSTYAGDTYTLHAQADEGEKGKPSGPKLDAGPYVVWRKFWYQVTHADGFNVPEPSKAVTAFRNVGADMVLAEKVELKKEDVPNGDRTFYPKWMLAGGSDTAEESVIGGHNRDWFYGRYKADARRPVKGHLIVCHHQWDPVSAPTKLHLFPMSARSQEVQLDLGGAWNAGILAPALRGELVVHGRWKVKHANAFTGFFKKAGIRLNPLSDKKTEGALTDANVRVVRGRAGLNSVQIVLPDDAPDPTKHPIVVELRVQYGKYYAGESNGVHMLIVYKAGGDEAFNQVVSHELGHGFGQVPRPGAASATLGDHPRQYTNEHGGVGSHCSTAATLGAVDASAPSGRYQGGTCIMFHQVNPGGCTQQFCDECQPYLRLHDMRSLA